MTRWTPLTRAAFRFLFVYLGLYSFASQIAGGVLLLPGLAFPSLGTRWPMREITLWLAAHVLESPAPSSTPATVATRYSIGSRHSGC